MSERSSQSLFSEQPNFEVPEAFVAAEQQRIAEQDNVIPFPNRMADLPPVPGSETEDTVEKIDTLPEVPEVSKQTDISDLVPVDATGRGHVPSGKNQGQFLSQEKMDIIAEHQDQIRDGLANHKQTDISDLIPVDARGHGHVPSGKHRGQFLSQEKMDIIAAHQDQIRDGLADRNVELIGKQSKPAAGKKASNLPPFPKVRHNTVDADDDTIPLIGRPPVPNAKPNKIDLTSADPDGDTVKPIAPKPAVPVAKSKRGNVIPVPADYDPKKVDDEPVVTVDSSTVASPNTDKAFNIKMNGPELANWAKDRFHLALIKGKEWFRKDDGEVNKKKAVFAAVAGVALVGAAIYAARNGFDHNSAAPDVQPAPRTVPGANPNGDPGLNLGDLGAVDPNAAPPVDTAPLVPTNGNYVVGSNPWTVSRDHLIALGLPNPSDSQIDAYKDSLLASNNMTEAQSYNIVPGTAYTLPSVDINSLR